MHDDEDAEESDGDAKVEILERGADPRGEELGEHPGEPRMDAEERLLGVHQTLDIDF